MHHLHRGPQGQGPRQCGKILQLQWIDAGGDIARCDLDQTQLRPIGALAQKFSIDSEGVGRRQSSGKLREVRLRGDDGLQRV